jgi:hypothetical protein
METLPSTIICRHGYCDKCAKEKRPHSGQRALVYGSHGFKIIRVEHIPRWYGFTPHLYKLIKVIQPVGDVIFETTCCMDHCGIELTNSESDGMTNYHVHGDKWQRGVTDLKTWNSLVMYKHDMDYFV